MHIIAYGPLAYTTSFYILPPIWQLGRRHGLQTQSDFFQKRCNSRSLSTLVAVIGIVFIIPYLQLQLTGLGIIVQVASYEGISRTVAMVIGFALVAAFVYASGLRAVAWVSVLNAMWYQEHAWRPPWAPLPSTRGRPRRFAAATPARPDPSSLAVLALTAMARDGLFQHDATR